MAPWVSFDQIKASIAVETLLASYGLEVVKRKNEELRLLCPFHEESTPSFCFNTNGKFYCFGCNIKGSDILDFVRLKEDYDSDRTKGRRQAAILIAERFGLNTDPPPRQNQSNGKVGRSVDTISTEEVNEQQLAKEEVPDAPADDEMPVNPPLKFELKNLDPDHPYLQERGLTTETIATFGLGFCSKGMQANRIAIPIHNEHGELVAYAGRSPGEPTENAPKYLLPLNFRKSLVLFNLHRAREHASEGLIVVEGFFTVFDLWQKGRRNVVATMGSSVSAEQERLIVDTVGPRGRVLLAFDPDEAGRRGMKDAAERLASQVFVRTVELPPT